MRRVLHVVVSGLIVVGVSLSAPLVAAEGSTAPAASPPAMVEVQARVKTAVSGWTTSSAAAASTVPLRVPLRVLTGDRFVTRTVSVQRRAAGKKKWKTIRTAATSAAGSYIAVLTAPAGTWHFRLRVKAGAGAGSTRTKPRQVVVTRLMVAPGGAHTCALRPGGRVRCWGSNDHGQLGDGTRTDRVRPVTVTGITGATAITAGRSHTCAVVAMGRVKCWGRNAYRQLGIRAGRDRLRPVSVEGVRGARVIAAGSDHTCAVMGRGHVTCWGTYGHIDEEEPDVQPTAPTGVPRLTGVSALASSRDFDCALAPRGRVSCWGANGAGELGDGTTKPRAKPVHVRKLPKATAIAAGAEHACAVVTRGRVACWGTNLYQGLGREIGDGVQGEGVPALSPVLVKGFTGQTSVTAGARHTCSLDPRGRVRCVGSDAGGQLGDGFGGPSLYRVVPVQVRGVTGALSVTAGNVDHTCVQLSAGPIMCWGDNSRGQLGDGTRTAAWSVAPVRVQGLSGVNALAPAPTYTCARGPRGTVSCWGLSEGKEPVERPHPQRVAGLSGASAVDAGLQSACAILAGGTVTCWDGLRPSKPAPVPGIKGAIGISSGVATYPNNHCAVLTDGTVTCWDSKTPPHEREGISGATKISLDTRGGCVMRDATVSCWTDPMWGWPVGGQTPRAVPGIAGATAVSRNEFQVCVVHTEGTVTCSNYTGDGRLGPPKLVSGITDATEIGAGDLHTCALLRRGGARCWGDNGNGQLGNPAAGSTTTSAVPVTGISTATAIGVGRSHTCAALIGGAVACWGDNGVGQLGTDRGWLPRRVVGL